MKRIVVGISGASGSPLALRFLEALRAQDDVEIHLVVSDSALLTASYELPTQQGSADANPFKRFAHVYHEPTAFDASISSGSFEVDAMVIIPCSMKTVAGIASGYADNLLLRAADVTIKVDPDRSDLIQTRIINGIKYILVRVEEGVEVNGVPVQITE